MAFEGGRQEHMSKRQSLKSSGDRSAMLRERKGIQPLETPGQNYIKIFQDNLKLYIRKHQSM